MTTATFKYTEDYIEFIAGHRDALGKTFGMFDTKPTPISLARYDVNVVNSLAEQTNWQSKAYTDKQAELAQRIVHKYRKQLSQLTPSVTVPEILDQYRLGIRIVDRSRRIYIDNDGNIRMKFPYDTKLIDLVKKQVKESQGHVQFDSDNKEWRLAVTEYLVNWVVTVGQSLNFEISDALIELYNKIIDCEKQEFSIKLIKTDAGYTITNAADSLVDFINKNYGGFGHDNLAKLIDASEVLGYSVDKQLYDELFKQTSRSMGLMISRRKHTFKDQTITIDHILDYARKLNRLPIHVYETGLPKSDTEEIIYLNRNADANVIPKLLVSKTALMVGTKKQAWITNAEKIFILE